jgi:hypothetical protein
MTARNNGESCQSCRFWKRGHCDRVEVIETTWNKEVVANDGFVITVYVYDDSGLEANLKTGPDFYCSQFSPVVVARS